MRPVAYDLAGTACEGLVSDAEGARIGVIVFPTVAGVSDHERDAAARLNAMGHTAFVADLYGTDTRDLPREAKFGLMNGLKADRAALRETLLAVRDVATAQPEFAGLRLAAAGFCFGGLCALDLARSGADLVAAASFHGLLTPSGIANPPIAARIAAFHGWDDPLARPDDVAAFGREMDAAGADWQLHAYGGTVHAFTNPQANDKPGGMAYNAAATRRAWGSLQSLLEET
ncbi:dienelactone hydrolase family protein [Allosphingosinicella indica]|uniref:Dienelactone hydrolase n=1 Tax=Allosphingosinicella indica TaxID=941907 RepID=A0A1X7G239_9SPHN|nr:dienelactone hydrolase family protein [Allosphingosinicella indica]SMF62462.1 Dienelactone hydrolase [Allosphingosinicella indica]